VCGQLANQTFVEIVMGVVRSRRGSLLLVQRKVALLVLAAAPARTRIVAPYAWPAGLRSLGKRGSVDLERRKRFVWQGEPHLGVILVPV
jgi:hypothetical protein